MEVNGIERHVRLSTGFVGILLLLALAGCAGTESMQSEPPFYDRLGGQSAISAVVDQFVTNVAGDQRINSRFAATDIPKLKSHLVDQVCNATGGPCTYSGRDMQTTHAGMRISNADCGALVENLVKALDTLKVPTQERSELLSLLGPMKQDIVETA